MSNQEYRLSGTSGFDSIKLEKSSSIPQPGPGEVQIKFHACSLNYRDLIISNGLYSSSIKAGIVPVSDGAGEITAVGEGVKHLKVGDRVSPNFNQDHIGGQVTEDALASSLGGALDGCLRQYGVFRAISCVKIPPSLTYEEAATLPCAALTAWNALYGDSNRALKPGQTVLVQGTGGVSLFGAQFALAAGAKVIIISSSNIKIAKVKNCLGLKNVSTINYIETPEWGKKAKDLTGGRGVDHILEVGGEKTLKQSFEALAFGGSIAFIGYLSILGVGPSMSGLDVCIGTLTKNASVRGILIGSVEQFNAMNAAIETHKIKPIIDKVFEFQDVKNAYEHQWTRKHIGKVVIKLPK
jgi:NADPH:quinone reductase-like Zn-dependent oxidoreductase